MVLGKKVHGEGVLECPRCRVGMRKVKKHDVILDVCRNCKGMWLDDQEIEKLLAFARGKQ